MVATPSSLGRLARSLALVALAATLASCDTFATGPDDDVWDEPAVEALGLDEAWVWTLAADGERLYAGTEDGLFALRRGEADAEWSRIGFEGQDVNAVLPDDDGSLLVAVRPGEDEEDPTSLYRASAGDFEWEPDQRGFGGEDGSFEVSTLARLPDGTLLAGGDFPVVARLAPDADEWTTVWGGWDAVGLGTHFVVVDPADPSVVWAGGELGAFRPFLIKSADGGVAWGDVQLDPDGDNAINSLAVDPRDSDRVYAGWEGSVQRSEDGGASWETVLEPEGYPYFYGLAVSPNAPGRVYAAGARNDPSLQDLVFRWSDDGGESWSTLREEGAGGVLSMLLTDREEVYLGTQDGVYRVVPDE